MTISYSGNFFRILHRWKGGVWSAIWKELLIWLVIFYMVRFILQFGLPEDYGPSVANTVQLFNTYTLQIPLEILLGFYVSHVVVRWWSQVENVPKPDDVMTLVNAFVPGFEKESKLKRHVIARYLILAETLALRLISKRIRSRFPTMQQILESGLMTQEEFELYKNVACENVHWQLPLQWIVNGALKTNSERIAKSGLNAIVKEVKNFRNSLQKLFIYDWICIPLIYTQVVSYVVYGYFAFAIVGHQHFGRNVDTIVPFLSILQFIFFVGWFKVAQNLTRPFGEDDDDVELNVILDRNASVAMSFADQICDKNPPLTEDEFFGHNIVSLPYTRASLKKGEHPPKLHAFVDVTDPGDLQFTDKKMDKKFTGKPIPGLQKERHPIHF